MIPIRTEYVISIDDVCNHFDTHINQYYFTQAAENGSYQCLSCDDGSLEELWEDYEWHKKWNTHAHELLAKKVRNDISLIEYLRAQGHRGPVLVYVCW